MPKSIGGLLGYAFTSIFMVAVGVAILSRTPVWRYIVGAPK